MAIERIALLSSGGDSPGMNAAIEELVNYGLSAGIDVYGCRGGFLGLAKGWISPLDPLGIFDVYAKGGTVLKTSRDADWMSDAGRKKVEAAVAESRLDLIVVLGGEGSIGRGAAKLREWGIAAACLPCTIDNDVPGSEESIGFDTACNRTIPLVDGIRDTAEAMPGRVFVLETLGGGTGHIAVQTAWINRAEAVIVPEVEFDWDQIASRLTPALERKGWALLVASEGVGDMAGKLKDLQEAVGVRARLTTVGHAQRGGPPSARDRALARNLAAFTVERLHEGKADFLAAICEGRPAAVPLAEIEGRTKPLDMALYGRINGIRD